MPAHLVLRLKDLQTVTMPPLAITTCRLTSRPLSNQAQATTLIVQPSDAKESTRLSGKTRSIYLAAEEIVWDYAPYGKDMCNNLNFRRDQLVRCPLLVASDCDDVELCTIDQGQRRGSAGSAC